MRRTSKRKTDARADDSGIAFASFRAKRDAVSWKGIGRAVRPSVNANHRISPSTTSSSADQRATSAATEARRAVTSSSDRVKSFTSAPFLWIWMRAPSSFASNASGSSKRARASSTDVAVSASIGAIARPTSSRKAASACAPPVIAASATAGRSPRSMLARRTIARAPRRHSLSHRSSRRRGHPVEGCLRRAPGETSARQASTAPRMPARSAARLPCEPAPDASAMSTRARSTSAIVSEGSPAAGGSEESDAQPTPMRRWRSSPESHATTARTSARSVARRSAAMRFVFADREEVRAISADASATSMRRVIGHRGRAARAIRRLGASRCRLAPPGRRARCQVPQRLPVRASSEA